AVASSRRDDGSKRGRLRRSGPHRFVGFLVAAPARAYMAPLTGKVLESMRQRAKACILGIAVSMFGGMFGGIFGGGSEALAATPAKAAGDDAHPGEEHDSPDSAPAADDRPTRAPAHADCDHRMPLWIHEVEAGDQLGRIAGRYGVRSRDL